MCQILLYCNKSSLEIYLFTLKLTFLSSLEIDEDIYVECDRLIHFKNLHIYIEVDHILFVNRPIHLEDDLLILFGNRPIYLEDDLLILLNVDLQICSDFRCC